MPFQSRKAFLARLSFSNVDGFRAMCLPDRPDDLPNHPDSTNPAPYGTEPGVLEQKTPTGAMPVGASFAVGDGRRMSPDTIDKTREEVSFTESEFSVSRGSACQGRNLVARNSHIVQFAVRFAGQFKTRIAVAAPSLERFEQFHVSHSFSCCVGCVGLKADYSSKLQRMFLLDAVPRLSNSVFVNPFASLRRSIPPSMACIRCAVLLSL